MGLLADAELRFDAMLRHLLDGLHCRRAGWSTGTFLRYLPRDPSLSDEEAVVQMLPRIEMVYVDPKEGTTEAIFWRVNQLDVLATDWQAFYGDVLPRNPAETSA